MNEVRNGIAPLESAQSKLWARFQANQGAKTLKFVLAECLGEAIGDLFVGGNVLQLHIAGGDLLADVVMTYVNMLGASMELGVLGKGHSPLVVAEDHDSFGQNGLVSGVELT